MDNDLMARRLRPPSQPNSSNGQGSTDQPQEPSPWDVPLTAEPQFAPPDPTAREDVPWDRPAAEPWPPVEQTWSAQAGGVPAAASRPEWPAADDLGQPAPWDHPENKVADPWRDPDDAFAPVVADVQTPAAWSAWNGSGNGNGNGNGHASSGSSGMLYAASSTPEPMTVTAHSDQPPAGDEPRSSGANPLPEWPAEDDLTVTPPPSRGPVMPEDSWPVAPAWPPVEPPPPASADSTEPAAAAQPEPDPDPEPEPEPEPEIQAQLPTAPPEPAKPTVEVTTPPNTQIVAVTPGGTPQNMVLRIELAIVDESHRANLAANPADTAKRVGPDADVRRPEYAPRNSGGRAPMPEPEYIWGAPPEEQNQGQPRPRQAQPAKAGQPGYPPQMPHMPPLPQQVAPPPSAWLPASQQPVAPAHSQNLGWDLPQVAPGQPMADPPAPWSTPAAPQSHEQSPYAPAPTWAMTQPTPPYQPEPPQYMPPPAPQYPQAAAPQYPQAAAPQYSQAAPQYQAPPAAQYPQPAWPAAPQPFGQPGRPQHMPQPVQSGPMVQSASAAGSRARTGGVAADQADLWFLNNQPTAAVTDDDAQPEGKANSILTAGLTIGFALLVIVLVLVFIQLMTSLLK